MIFPMRHLLWISALALASAAQAAPAWITHHNPAGFSLQLPDDWQVRSDIVTDIAIADARARATAFVRARLVRGNLTRWLSTEYASTEPGMREFRIEQVKSNGPDLADARIRYVNTQGIAKRGHVVAVRRGAMATLFIAAAPPAEWNASLPILARILDSVRFEAPKATGKGKSSEAPRLSYTQWVDPREQAFAVDLPAGWRNEGGLQRTTWNRRVAFSSTSPDGQAILFSGDANVPRMFILPNQITAQYGGGMNQSWGPEAQIVMQFQSAADFGTSLVQQRFRGQVTDTKERPDLVQIAQRNPLLTQGLSAVTAADVEFRLADGRFGVLTLVTFGTQVAGVGGNWWAEGVHGFIAPPARVLQTGAALAHLIASFQTNPNWATAERQHEGTMSRQWTEYLAYSAQLQQLTIENRWASDEARQRQMRDVLGGTVRLQDPQTGEVIETTARDRYYYRVNQPGQTEVVGTETDFNPAPQLDLRKLMQVGVDVPDR